jgi:hypothetical protein
VLTLLYDPEALLNQDAGGEPAEFALNYCELGCRISRLKEADELAVQEPPNACSAFKTRQLDLFSWAHFHASIPRRALKEAVSGDLEEDMETSRSGDAECRWDY